MAARIYVVDYTTYVNTVEPQMPETLKPNTPCITDGDLYASGELLKSRRHGNANMSIVAIVFSAYRKQKYQATGGY